MRILYSPGFLRSFRKLTVKIQNEFRQRESAFRQNPFNPRLKTHKLKNRSDWAFLVTYEIRVTFTFEKDVYKFLNIGDHSIYRKK